MKLKFLLTFNLLLSLCFGHCAHGAASDDTMLMFVGESEPVTTVASRQPESPTMAPAMVTLVDHAQIKRHGYRTLAELLNDQPGFFMLSGGRGTTPYFRGLVNSVLFLYDGVPITTGVTKEFAPLGKEFSLECVDRVEIMSGPGSVLWGADAFAAVVNIVPAQANQRSLLSISGTLGNSSQRGGWSSTAINGEQAHFYLYGSVQQDQFYNDLYLSEIDRYDRIDNSRYREIVSTFQYGKWLHVSGRWSDFERNFTMVNSTQELVWPGSKETPFSYLKFSATGDQGAAHYSLNGFWQTTEYQLRDADTQRSQTNHVYQLEGLWDQRVFNRGLVTAGISWRRNEVRGALVKDGFLPDFLKPEEPLFKPIIEQANFNSEIFSGFGQFRYRMADQEWWIGGRVESHSEYGENVTTSLGYRLIMNDSLYWKTVYGSAFRTPFSSQLYDQELKQEKIKTLSTQLGWTPTQGQAYTLTLYRSSLTRHRNEDPYGGLSLEQTRKIFGAELSIRHRLGKSLSLNTNFSWVRGDKGQEMYHNFLFSVVLPNSQIDVYDDWNQPYDQGPRWMVQSSLDWSISTNHSLLLTVRATGDLHGSYDKGAIREKYESPLLVNLTYHLPGFLKQRDSLTLRITNLLDENYQLPDVYGPVDGPPISAILSWRLDF